MRVDILLDDLCIITPWIVYWARFYILVFREVEVDGIDG